jgi:hypothetical protein
MCFSEKQFDQAVNGIEWQTSFHRKIAVILLVRNTRIITEDQLIKNVEVINSVHKGMTTVISIDDLLKRGCDFAIGD